MCSLGRRGPYLLLKKLGEGGMAVVYRGVHVRTGEVAAVKTPREDKGHQARLFGWLRREVQAMKRLQHPGIVRIIDSGMSDPTPWYSMELLKGQTLEDHMRDRWSALPKRRPQGSEQVTTPETEYVPATRSDVSPETLVDPGVPPRPPQPPRATILHSPDPAGAGKLEEILRIALMVCDALAYLHARRIVHRDLSLRNLFLREDGSAAIMDFGLASLLGHVSGRARLDAERVPQGTIAYVSPEQILGEHVSPRSDLYSFGCVLYEMITRHPPFPVGPGTAIKEAHIRRPPRPLSESVTGVPKALDDLVLSLLEKDPRDRPGYAVDVAASLREILGDPPVSASALVPVHLHRPRIVGRAPQLLRVFDLIEASPGRRGNLGLLRGESGSGKTSIATAVAQHAWGRGRTVITGECGDAAAGDGAPVTSAVPFFPLRPLLTAIHDHCREKGADTTKRILGTNGKILSAYEPALLHLPGQAGAPDLSDLRPHAVERRLIEALTSTVCAFADEVRLLLILDDLQWADDLTLKFLLDLSDAVLKRHSLVILGAYRPEQGKQMRVLSQIASHPWVRECVIPPLDREAVRSIASDMLGTKSLHSAHVSVLYGRSGGNPFFVAECLRMLVAEGWLSRQGGSWECRLAGASLDAVLPHEVEHVLNRRLRKLSKAAAEIAGVAAVLGREVDTRLLAKLLGDDKSALAEGLSELFQAGIFEEADEDRLRFVHDKIREAAYRALPADRARALHRAAAREIAVDRVGRGEPPPYGAVAVHLHRAGDLAGARAAYERAGEAALKAFGSRDAIHAFNAALELMREMGGEPDRRRQARCTLQLARAYIETGQSEQAVRHLLEGLGLLGWPTPRSTRGLLRGIASQAARLFARVALGPRALTEEQRARFAEAGSAIELLVPVFTYTTGARLRLFHSIVLHLHVAETLGAPRELALAYVNAHVILGLAPFAPFARICGERAKKALASIDDAHVKSWVHLLLCIHATGNGEWEEAISHGEMSAELAAGSPRRWEEAEGMLCTANLLRGEPEQATRTSHKRYADAALRGDVQTQLWAACGLSQAELNMGRTAWVMEHAEWIEQQLQAHSGRNERIFGHAVLAEAWLRVGDRRRALEHARAGATEVGEGWPPVVYCANAYSLLAGVLLDLCASARDDGERRSLQKEAFHMCREVFFSAFIYPVHRARCALLWGRLFETYGSPGLASRLHRQSLALAQRHRLPFDEALAEVALARTEPGRDGERRSRLQRARTLFSTIQAAHQVSRVDAELALSPA